MAISRKGNLVAGASKNGGNVALTLSSAAASGDVIYLIGGHHTAGGGSYGDSGGTYTQVKAPDTTGAFGFGVWRLVCTGAVTTVTGLGNGNGNDVTAYACAVYSGADNTTPEDVAIPAYSTATSTNPDAPSIDPVTNDCAILICAISTTADASPGTPSNYATPVLATASDTTGALQVTISDRIITGSAVEDPPSFGTYSSGTWKAVTIAVRPAGTNVSANPTGVAATGAANTPTVTGLANVSVTGVNATGAANAPTIVIGQTVSITGVSATGNPGNLNGLAILDENGLAILDENGEVILDDGGILGKANVSLTGVAAAGQPGTATADTGAVNVDASPTGVAATGAVNIPTVTGFANVDVTGVNATGAANTPTITGFANVNVTGVNATGAANTPTVTGKANVTLTGVNATGAANTPTVTAAANISVTGVAATGAANTPTVTGLANVNVTGVAATGAIGTVAVTADGSVSAAPPAVTATGVVGTPTVTGNASVAINGVAAVAAAGDLAVAGLANVLIDGVAAAGAVGTLTATTDAVIPTAIQKDGDPDYWNLPWFQVEGESFADQLRAKTLEALDEAFGIVEDAEPAKAKRAARKAAKGLQAYAKAAGALLSDDTVTALGQAAKQLNYTASQWDRSELLERVSEARMALLAYEAQQQDEEDALIALMLVA